MMASIRASKQDHCSKKDGCAETKDDKSSAHKHNLIVQLMEQKASVDEEDEVEVKMVKSPGRGVAGGKVFKRSPLKNPGM